MNKTLKMVIILSLFSVFSAASLCFVYQYTLPKVEKNREEKLKETIFSLVDGAKNFSILEKEGEILYAVKDSQDKTIAYCFMVIANGYQDKISLMCAVKTDLKTLIGISVLESYETPGLGSRIEEKDFKNQFVNLSTYPSITITDKKPANNNEVQAITGATVSSRAVINGLNAKLETIRKVYETQ